MTNLETTSTLDLITELRRRRTAVVTFTADDLAGFFRSGHPDWRLRDHGYDDQVADWLLRESGNAIEELAWSSARAKLIDFIAEAHTTAFEGEHETA